MKDYPAELLKPLTTLKDEIEALKKVDAKKLKAVLLDELKTQLPNLLKRTVTAVLNRAKDDIGTLMLETVNCGLKGKDSPSIRDRAKKTVKNAVKAEWTLFSNKLLTQSLTRLRKEVPALTQQNIDRIKSAFTTSLDDKKEGFVDYLVDTFQDKVFNYTAVIDKITNTDFKAKAKEIMIGALNASTAKLADKAVASLVENLGEQLEVKSGAGATPEQDDSDADIVWITPEEGWKITAGKDKAAWSYTDYTSKTDDKKTDDKKSDPEKSGKLKVYSKVVNGETKYYIKASANKSVELYSAGFAVGGTVGVAVNAVVSVLKSNTTAELGGKASLTGDLNVKASGKRDVTSVGANLAAGAVGAGVNVQVLVAGEKMSQDAADMMTYGNSTSKGSQKTFDANALMENLSGTKDENGKEVKPALDNGGSKYYKDDVNGSVLAEDTAGNGHYESEQSAGGRGTSSGKSVGTFDATSGYRSGDFDNKSYNDGGETQRGENLKAKDTKDIQKAKAINTYSYSEAPSDAVIARITDTAMIEKARDVTVLASQPFSADLFGATVGGGAVGVGVSVSAESVSAGDVTDRSSALKKMLKNIAPTGGGIRAVGVSVGAGAVGVSVGAGAFALGVAVSQVNAKVNTLADRATLKATGTVEVFNDVISASTPKVLSLAGGGLAAGGNVLLAFNETESRARVSGGSVNAAALNVVADLQGTAESKLTAAQVSGIAVGLSVNYADMRADNRAILENCAVNVKDLLVRTGRSSHDNTSAVANTVAGSMGFFALNMNAAIARNNAKNYAVIEGGNVTATKSLLVRGYDKATADAGVEGVNAGYLSVAVNAVVALNDADTRAIVKLDKLNAGSATFEVFQKASADAKIVTGGGAMYKGDASVAVAYGRGSGVIDVDVKKLTASSVRAMNDTADAANATVSNGSYAAVKAAALIGAAYSQGVYDTKVKLGDGSSVSGNIDVTTDYGGRIKADVTPHKGGLDASLLKLGLSLASATSNGAKNVSFLTLGNLESRATASDSFNAALQGVTVNATGEALVRARANTKSDAYGGVPGGFSVVNGGRLVLNADAMGDAKSLVNSSSTGILLNVNSMKGENTFHEDVNLLVGDSVRLNADDVMFIYADGRAYMDAQSIYSGSFSVINEAAATAQNTLRRTQNVSIGRGAHLAANQIWISNYPGLAEKVNVKAEENTSSSAIEWVKSDAKNDVEITGVLSVGPAVRITGEVSVKITGEAGGEYNANAVINAREGLRPDRIPTATSRSRTTCTSTRAPAATRTAR